MASTIRHLALAFSLLLVFGCLSQPQPQNSTAPGPQPSGTTPEAWAHYSNLGMSFDYPAGMSINESSDSYPRSATVVVQSSDAAEGAIIVEFMNASLAANISTHPPQEIAAAILDYDNTSGSDMLLSQADGTSAISNSTSPGGLAVAEMRFTLPAGNLTLYGYALEMYDPAALASYPVRILSSSPNQTQSLRDRFVSSFRSG